NYTLDDFFETLNKILIKSVQNNRDILTWSRYDNHHIFKLLLNNVVKDENEKIEILKKVGKITPLLEYNHNGYTITILNIIKDSIIFEIRFDNSKKRVNIYNLKNLFQSDLLTIAQNYNLTYYSKLGEEFHIIDKVRFFDDKEYQKMVLKSNELDSKVIIDIANKFIDSFIDLTGTIPKTIYTAGSIARSFLLSAPEINPYKINFYHMYKDNPYYDKLLDYTMKSYHGGKIDSYVIGYVGDAYVADITSAYPSVISELPELTQNVIYRIGPEELEQYYYAFVRCNVFIPKSEFIHPLIVQSPISPVNISPQGYLQNIIITKPEYEYLLKYKNKYNLKIEVIDYIAIEHENRSIFKNLVHDLFNKRLKYKNEGNNVLADLTKTIINSVYGITYELTPIYEINDDEDIEKI